MCTYIVPQYDANGFDSGLWLMYHNDAPVYENLTLGLRGDTLIVGQYDWDNESYTESGDIDAEYKELLEFTCPNPYQDNDAAEYLRMHLVDTDAETIL